MVSGEEADAVLDWLRAVRRALANGTGAAMAVPPSVREAGGRALRRALIAIPARKARLL